MLTITNIVGLIVFTYQSALSLQIIVPGVINKKLSSLVDIEKSLVFYYTTLNLCEVVLNYCVLATSIDEPGSRLTVAGLCKGLGLKSNHFS